MTLKPISSSRLDILSHFQNFTTRAMPSVIPTCAEQQEIIHKFQKSIGIYVSMSIDLATWKRFISVNRIPSRFLTGNSWILDDTSSLQMHRAYIYMSEKFHICVTNWPNMLQKSFLFQLHVQMRAYCENICINPDVCEWKVSKMIACWT